MKIFINYFTRYNIKALEKQTKNDEFHNESFDELKWIELELENDDKHFDLNEVNDSNMIKGVANVENFDKQNEFDELRLKELELENDENKEISEGEKPIMILKDELKEYDVKQNCLDDEQSILEDKISFNLIKRDKLIQKNDEQNKFDDMKK